MAIINNNVQNVKFLRNGNLFASRSAALEAMEAQKANLADGVAILGRYSGETADDVKTLVGFAYISGDTKTLTIIDVEGAKADVEALRQEINAKLGNDVTSANTASAQFAALSGTSEDASGVTSIGGAKNYAKDYTDAEIDKLDYTGVTTGTGVYVTNVTEANGIISATTAELPSVEDTAVDLKFVTKVDESLGQISVSRGEITSSNKTISLSANTDGGVDFKANVDGTTIIIDENTGTMSVASSALVQYEGDGKTVQISEVVNGVRTVSSPLTISSTTVTDTNVKEQFNLVNASGETVGATIKIYKDSSLHSVYLGHVDDTLSNNTDPTSIVAGTGSEALCFIYHKEDGTYELVAVDVEAFLMESEFASGVTADGTTHIVHGVVDSASESFLTVGAGGFKLSGVQDAIDGAVNGLDATVSAETAHVTVGVEEVDGKITAVTVSESNIANADDLATLSGKTVTALTSTNGSITASIDDAAGCKTYDIETDASKIKMSGFTSTDVLSGITSSSSITEAFSEVDKVITDNEEVTAAALNDLDTRIKELSGGSASDLADEIAARKAVDGINGSAYSANTSATYINNATSLNDADQKLDAAIDNIADKYVSGITVNGSGLTVTNNIATVTVTPANSATTASGDEAITVDTDANGNITLGLANIDCGFYE